MYAVAGVNVPFAATVNDVFPLAEILNFDMSVAACAFPAQNTGIMNVGNAVAGVTVKMVAFALGLLPVVNE